MLIDAPDRVYQRMSSGCRFVQQLQPLVLFLKQGHVLAPSLFCKLRFLRRGEVDVRILLHCPDIELYWKSQKFGAFF